MKKQKIIFIGLYILMSLLIGCKPEIIIDMRAGLNDPWVKVVDSQGEGVAGVNVTVSTTDGTFSGSGLTDSTGIKSFVLPQNLESIKDKDFTITASLPDSWSGTPYTFFSKTAKIKGYAQYIGEIQAYDMRPFGKIINNIGAPVSGAQITITKGSFTGTAISDGQGKFLFTTGVEEGDYEVTIVKQGFSFVQSPITINKGSVDIGSFVGIPVLETKPFGRIIDSNGTGLNDVNTTITDGTNQFSVLTANGGYFAFANEVADGNYTVIFVKSGYSFKSIIIEINKDKLNLGTFVGEQLAAIKPYGKVLDSTGVNGINSAVVTLSSSGYEQNVTTAIDGSFIFANEVTEGNYTVTVTKTGFTFKSFNMRITRDKLFIGNIIGDGLVPMLPYGRVLDSTGVNGISSAVVRLSKTGYAQNATTDANGSFIFASEVVEGNYTVDVNKTGFNFKTFTVGIKRDQLYVGNIIGDAVVPIKPFGTVIDSNGTYLSDVNVTISKSGYSQNATTDTNGSFIFASEVTTGLYTVSASKTGYNFTSFMVDVKADNFNVGTLVGEINIPIKPFGRVVDRNGTSGISSVNVVISKSGYSQNATTDTNGSFVFANEVTSGLYTISATKTGYLFRSFSVNISKNNLNVGTIFDASAATHSISGKIINAKDINKNGINNATIKAFAVDLNGTIASTESGSATSASDGTYSITGLSNGEYLLKISKGVVTSGSQAIGYAFLEESIVVQGADITNHNMRGFAFDSYKDDYAISIILVWEDNFMDCDGILSYPTTAISSGAAGPANYKPYGTSTEIGGTIATGFSPEVASASSAYALINRERIWWAKTSTAGTGIPVYDNTTQIATDMKWGTYDYDSDSNGTNDTYKLQLDSDCRVGSGPESITLRTFPVTQRGTNTIDMSGAFGSSFNAGYWLGTMAYYVDAYASTQNNGTETTDGTLSSQGTGKHAGAKVYVFQTYGDTDMNGTKDDPSASILGIYTIPVYTTVKNASVLRITMVEDNSGYDYFVIYPDIKVLSLLSTGKTDYTQMKSIGNGAILVPTGRK